MTDYQTPAQRIEQLRRDALERAKSATGQALTEHNSEAAAYADAARIAADPFQPGPDMIERAAQAMFEDPTMLVEGGELVTWAEVVRDDPSRAEIWREDARRVLAAAGHPGMSNVISGGTPLTWEERSGDLQRQAATLSDWARMISDLSRNENGRHQGDADGGDPTGTSQGNPHIAVGQVFGYSISGARRAYARPARQFEHMPQAWIVDATANTPEPPMFEGTRDALDALTIRPEEPRA